MNTAPMNEPNTMLPAQAATQKVRRLATWRSNSGLFARRCRMKKAIPAATAMTATPRTSAPSLGTAAKLMTRMSAPMNSADRMPPRLSTGFVVSLTWLGTSMSAITRATTASGKAARKTEPQHGGGQADGLAHDNEVERGLRRVERCADGRQGDIGH